MIHRCQVISAMPARIWHDGERRRPGVGSMGDVLLQQRVRSLPLPRVLRGRWHATASTATASLRTTDTPLFHEGVGWAKPDQGDSHAPAGETTEVASAILFFATPAAGFATGSNRERRWPYHAWVTACVPNRNSSRIWSRASLCCNVAVRAATSSSIPGCGARHRRHGPRVGQGIRCRHVFNYGHPPELPKTHYNLALIDLAEGPRMMAGSEYSSDQVKSACRCGRS
jgi:hypothetical protein